MNKIDSPTFLCPDCRVELQLFGKRYKCNSCGRTFLFDKRNIDILPISFDKNNWVNEEMNFWNAKYKEDKTSKMSDRMENRLRVRRKMIEYLKEHKKIDANTRILDVGAGDGYTSFYLLNPDIEKHLYFALDISKNGLDFLRDRIKSAITIRSTMENIPFKPSSFDVIFIWGALHHTKNKEQIISPLTKLLKKDGYILMYEGLRPESSLLKWFGRIMKKIINESAHEDRIGEERIKKVLRKNLNVVWYKKEYTPVRTILVIVLYKLGILDKYDFVNNVVMVIDYILINTIGKVMKSFSGGAVSVIGIKK